MVCTPGDCFVLEHSSLTKCTQTDLLDIFRASKSPKPAANDFGAEAEEEKLIAGHTPLTHSTHLWISFFHAVEVLDFPCRKKKKKKNSCVSCNISSPEDSTLSVTSNHRIHSVFGQVPVFPPWTEGD